jgi:hypothetical protein
VGAEVRRPSNPHSRSIHRFLSSLAATGFAGASVPLGTDADGRERLEFIEGAVAIPPYPSWVQTDAALASLARLMRRFHAASGQVELAGGSWSDDMADPEGGTVVCHNDVCLENVVFRDGVAVALLDFDFAAPGRLVYDLAQCARMCVPIDDDVNAARLGWSPANRPERLRLFADAYGLDRAGRDDLFAILAEALAHPGEFLRRKVEAGDVNFIALWNEHGGEARFERLRKWWAQHRERFQDALHE